MKRNYLLLALFLIGQMSITCSLANASAIAKAGLDKIVLVGETFTLDGSESSDPENGSLSFDWSFISRPDGSSAVLDNSSSANPTFVPDIVGKYLIGITVTDEDSNSASNAVEIRGVDGSLMASRTSGVAPLYVFFNSGFTSSTETNRPFHDLTYKWNFNDSAGDRWAITGSTLGASKNEDCGPVAAHVFENPGTYDVSLDIYNASGNLLTSKTVQVVVSDPETVYGPSNTICIGDLSSDSTGCPGIGSGATYVATDDILDIGDYVDTGKRVLLHRGSTWSASTTVLSKERVDGPITIGAYGSCNSPDDRGICDNAPIINVAENSNFLTVNDSSDWRVKDLHLIGQKLYNSAVGTTKRMESLLIQRLKVEGFQLPIGITSYNTKGHDQVAIVDCDISDGHSNGIYAGSERLAIMGTMVRSTTGEHNIRIWQASYGIISHNLLYESTKIGIKLHGVREETISKTDDTMLDRRSEYIVVSDNVIGSTYVYAVSIGSQNAQYDERLYDVLVEKNRFLSGYGTIMNPDNPLYVLLTIHSFYTTIRNNVFDGSISPSYLTALTVGRRGTPLAPANINIYNNTIYYNTASPDSSYSGMYINEAENVKVTNNLIQLPASATKEVAYCQIPGEVELSYNLVTDDALFIDHTNSEYLLRNFDIQAISPAVDIGRSLPVIEDLAGKKRPTGSGWDVGAYELSESMARPGPPLKLRIKN